MVNGNGQPTFAPPCILLLFSCILRHEYDPTSSVDPCAPYIGPFSLGRINPDNND